MTYTALAAQIGACKGDAQKWVGLYQAHGPEGIIPDNKWYDGQTRLSVIEIHVCKWTFHTRSSGQIRHTLQLGKILQSMLGVGPIISAAFVGEVGDISRFSSWKQVRSLAGLNLVENSSGKHKSKTKVSKRGRTYLRHMLYMAGDAVADVTLKCERFTDICEIARTIRSTAIKRLWQLASR